MKVGYYPGCSLEVTGSAYNHSTQKVCEALDVELQEIPGWSCCGSSPALKMDGLLSTALAAHNLALGEKANLKDVLIPCPFCYRRLLSSQDEIKADGNLKTKVEGIIEAGLSGDLKVLNLLEFLHRVGLNRIKANVVNPLIGLKVLPYYGCYLLKPAGVTHFDDPENPTSMDKVLESLGAKVLDWDFKAECCGSGLSLSKTEKVVELSGRLIREAVWRGADAIVVVCQLCHANLDMRQKEASKMYGSKYRIPIVYLTQLMGVAYGFSNEALGLNHHLVSPQRVLKKVR